MGAGRETAISLDFIFKLLNVDDTDEDLLLMIMTTSVGNVATRAQSHTI